MQNFRALGAPPPDPRASGGWGTLPPNPQPPAAGGFAPRPPLASGGWGLRPQTPQTAPPIANFWLRACMQEFMLKQSNYFWFMHDVDAYGNSSLFFMFKTYENAINFFFCYQYIGRPHAHCATMTRPTVLLTVFLFKNLTVKHQTKTATNHLNSHCFFKSSSEHVDHNKLC